MDYNILQKIALIIPTMKVGGMERVMAELCWYMSEKPEVELHLILYGPKRELFYSIPEKVILHKPDFEFYNVSRFWYTLKILFFIRKTVKDIKPTTSLSFGEYWNNLVLIAIFGLGIQIYISDRSSPNKKLKYLHNILRKILYPLASGMIAQTRKAEEIANAKKRNNNIKIIGNPIKLMSSIKNEDRENIILTVGRLIKTKHHDELIKIFAQINPIGWKLIIIGGDERIQQNNCRLKTLIASLKMENKIILSGECQNIEYYYLKSKIFAFTSSSEGFPNVVGEALSAGLPVVSFDCVAGPSEMIVEGENGFLVPLFDYLTFKNRLTQLIKDDLLRENMGFMAKLSIQKFSAKTIGEEYFSFITEKRK